MFYKNDFSFNCKRNNCGDAADSYEIVILNGMLLCILERRRKKETENWGME